MSKKGAKISIITRVYEKWLTNVLIAPNKLALRFTPSGKRLTTLQPDNEVKDARGKKLKIYPEVIQVLDTLKANKILIAAASRTHAPPTAQDMMNCFDLDKYFDFKEIYPGEKTTHFQKIKKDSNVQYEDMLFFDDEERNIVAISRLNVVCYLVKNEVSLKTFKEGLALFAEKRARTQQ